MANNMCNYKGCQQQARPDGFVYGNAYCKEHYLLGLENAFREEVSLLVVGEATRKLRNLFGRYAEGVYSSRGELMPEALAGTKLRDRAENIQYRDNTITFTIERHPQPIPIQQQWRFDLEDKVFTLISAEPTLLDCREAAAILGKTEQTVRKYIKQGKIQGQRASEKEQIDLWFEDKLSRQNYDTWNKRNRIIRPNKWFIPREELLKFVQGK
jgi:hypothetical protein